MLELVATDFEGTGGAVLTDLSLVGDDVDGAAVGVSAVQSALRAFRDFDALHVEQHAGNTLGLGEIGTVQVDGVGVLRARAGVRAEHAADHHGHRCPLRGDDDVRNGALNIAQLQSAGTLQIIRRGRFDHDRDLLHVLCALLSRHHHFFQLAAGVLRGAVGAFGRLGRRLRPDGASARQHQPGSANSQSSKYCGHRSPPIPFGKKIDREPPKRMCLSSLPPRTTRALRQVTVA
jgi:hypothetical protein